MTDGWISVHDALPEDDQPVLGFIPGHKAFLPGKDLQFEIREVVVLRFCKDFYARNEEKSQTRGALLGWRRQQQPLFRGRDPLAPHSKRTLVQIGGAIVRDLKAVV